MKILQNQLSSVILVEDERNLFVSDPATLHGRFHR